MGASCGGGVPEARRSVNGRRGQGAAEVATETWAWEGQDHVYAFAEQLTDEERQILEDQMENLDTNEFARQLEDATNRPLIVGIKEFVQPPPMNWMLKKPPKVLSGCNITVQEHVKQVNIKTWQNLGLRLIATGTIGVIIMAGGGPFQGLGSVGMADIGLPSNKCMFQIFCERVLRLQQLSLRATRKEAALAKEDGIPTLYSDNIIARKEHMQKELVDDENYMEPLDVDDLDVPVYVMVNPCNMIQVEKFFHAHGYFGMRRENVVFFQQSESMVVNAKGKILMREIGSTLRMPSGNGDLFQALRDNGIFGDMKARGVTAVYVAGCNNLLARIADPMFLGYSAKLRTQVCMKTGTRVIPEERLRVLANKSKTIYKDEDGDGELDQVKMVAPTSISPDRLHIDTLKQRSASNRLFFDTGELGQYYFTLQALEKLGNKACALHAKRISVPHLSIPEGMPVHPRPGERNAVYLESHLSDCAEAFPFIAALTVDRTRECAYFRSPEDIATALNKFCMHTQEWLIAVGSRFAMGQAAGYARDSRCEVSPLVSYDGEDLYGLNGSELALPLYIKAASEQVVSATKTEFSNVFDEAAIFGPRRELLTLTAKGGDAAAALRLEFKNLEEETENCESSQRLCSTPRTLKKESKRWLKETSAQQQAHKDKIARLKEIARKRNEAEDTRIKLLESGDKSARSGRSGASGRSFGSGRMSGRSPGRSGRSLSPRDRSPRDRSPRDRSPRDITKSGLAKSGFSLASSPRDAEKSFGNLGSPKGSRSRSMSPKGAMKMSHSPLGSPKGSPGRDSSPRSGRGSPKRSPGRRGS